jgi:signal transduction histidine kinase
MNNNLQRLARRYAALLREHLKNEHEAVLEQAYELGRAAVAEELGVLDMARVHHQALGELLRANAGAERNGSLIKAAEVFLLESLSPFEALHRGFRRMILELRERNRELEAEIGERKRAEEALRQSEKHFRQLFNEAQAMQENLRDLSDKVLRTQEDERKRISRELHDEVGQSLTAISVTLATLNHPGAGNSNVSSQNLAHTQRLLQETMETVHGFARDLRPAMLDELGLLPALRSYLEAFRSRTGLHVRFCGDPLAEQLGNDQKVVVFRIAQESLTNVIKHAHASQVKVAVRKLQDSVCMEVVDNGRSFTLDPADARRSKGRLGLLGMQERVRLVNGQFTVKPQPGKGTTVRVVIPFNTNPKTLIASRSQYGKDQSSAR